MKWSLTTILGIIATAFIIIALFYVGNASYQYYETEAFMNNSSVFEVPSGKIQITVVDGFKEKPLRDATVVIPETNGRYLTNEEGKTPIIQVPIIQDMHFKDILSKPWGEITVLVYKEGYNEYALFYTHVWENQVRNGPKILLFPKDKNGNNQPFSLIEGPHRLWVNELIEKYRKK